jgi:hypothetical protein
MRILKRQKLLDALTRKYLSEPKAEENGQRHDPHTGVLSDEEIVAKLRRAKNAAKFSDLKRRISDVVDAVLEGSQDRGRAAVAIQGFNALRGVLELERKIKEADDLEARIEALERPQEGGGRWRA